MAETWVPREPGVLGRGCGGMLSLGASFSGRRAAPAGRGPRPEQETGRDRTFPPERPQTRTDRKGHPALNKRGRGSSQLHPAVCCRDGPGALGLGSAPRPSPWPSWAARLLGAPVLGISGF